MGRFEIGDKVRIVHPPEKLKECEGKIMVIVGIGAKGVYHLVEDSESGSRERPKIWSECFLEHVRPEIVIYRDGDAVRAENHLTGKMATIKCFPNDEGFEASAREAFERIIDFDPAAIYGYPVKELIAFAAACREQGVENDDLARFAQVQSVKQCAGDQILWDAVLPRSVEYGRSVKLYADNKVMEEIISPF